MRKIIFIYHTGYCGSDGIDAATYHDDITDDELHQDAWCGAIEHAERYGIYPESDRDLYEEEGAEIDDDDFSSNIEGYWEDYNPKKHDMLKPGGGKWFD